MRNDGHQGSYINGMTHLKDRIRNKYYHTIYIESIRRKQEIRVAYKFLIEELQKSRAFRKKITSATTRNRKNDNIIEGPYDKMTVISSIQK